MRVRIDRGFRRLRGGLLALDQQIAVVLEEAQGGFVLALPLLQLIRFRGLLAEGFGFVPLPQEADSGTSFSPLTSTDSAGASSAGGSVASGAGSAATGAGSGAGVSLSRSINPSSLMGSFQRGDHVTLA